MAKTTKRGVGRRQRGGRQVGGKLASGPGPAEAGGRGGAIPPSPAPARFRDVKNVTWTEEFGGVYKLEISCYMDTNQELWRKLNNYMNNHTKSFIFRTSNKVYKAQVKNLDVTIA